MVVLTREIKLLCVYIMYYTSLSHKCRFYIQDSHGVQLYMRGMYIMICSQFLERIYIFFIASSLFIALREPRLSKYTTLKESSLLHNLCIELIKI